MTASLSAVKPGDTAHLRKAHPCGGRTWRVTRIGADIGLECLTCARRVMLTRDEFERRCARLEAITPVDGDPETAPLVPPPGGGKDGREGP